MEACWSAALLCAGALWSVTRRLLHKQQTFSPHWFDDALGFWMRWASIRQQRALMGWLGTYSTQLVRQKAPQLAVTPALHGDGVWFAPSGLSTDGPCKDGEHPDLLVLYMHGGGMVFGTATSNTRLLARTVGRLKAEGVKCALLSLEYDLAPEAPFPQQLAQVVTKIQQLLLAWHTEPVEGRTSSQHCPPAVVLMGDSAGGNLVLAALLALHQHCPVPALSHSLPPIAGAVLLSPWLDLTPGASVNLPVWPARSRWWTWPLPWRHAANPSSKAAPPHSVPQHVYPCTKHTQPADTCECVVTHRTRLQADYCGPYTENMCAELYVRGTPAAHGAGKGSSSNCSLEAEAACGGCTSKVHSHIYGTLLQQVNGCMTVEALKAHPLVSPGLADPAVMSAALRSQCHTPALVLAGELEVCLPDMQRMVDGVNKAAAAAQVRQGGAQKPPGCQAGRGMIELVAWEREVHDPLILIGRDALLPQLTGHLAGVARAWQAECSKRAKTCIT